MAKQPIKAPRGTQDIMGEQVQLWQFIESCARKTAYYFGFQEIRTPMFEPLSLFSRTVGQTSDVVQKEMYQVHAEKSEELYALKPEGTASVVRSVLEHHLLSQGLPLKLFYLTPCFRHERPQAGRLRQFHQFGVEMFGATSPLADVQVMELVVQFFKQLRLQQIHLLINSIGCPQCRPPYYQVLRAYFEKQASHLCPTCHDRLVHNPMRLLDCKNPTCAQLAEQAPVMLSFLCESCHSHFNQVQGQLSAQGISYKVDPTIVRGLDYYTKTVFEFVSNDLGAQSTVCGGGRYDGLIEQMGGPPTSGLGFAIGLERLLMILQKQSLSSLDSLPNSWDCTIFVGSIGFLAQQKASQLVSMLHQQCITAECDLIGRSVKAQMKYANKIKAKFSMILGDQELESGQAQLKQMQTGEQQLLFFDSQLVSALSPGHQK